MTAARLISLAGAMALGVFDSEAAEKQRPLMRDFMGLCGHTVLFKPDLYAPVTRLVRDYHPMQWDVGEDTGYVTKFPMAKNGVDWSQVYGSWLKAGYRAHASIMFDDLAPAAWKDLPKDAFEYGKAFATALGPMLEAAEIGNEPGKYDDATYRKLFEAMARGLRAGSPHLGIATCAVNLGPSGSYSKSVDCLKGLEPLYDILNIHLYPEVASWPTWERSYAENSKIDFLKHLKSVLTWRDQNVPDKEVWLTEFGYDASSKPPETTGDRAKWIGSTETQQAQWTVRAYMVLAASGLDRAYLYFFNDDDTPYLHGSSGLTRNFVPKPAFHAVAHLQKALGDFRLVRTIQETPEAFVYEFASEKQQRIWAVWKPEAPSAKVSLELKGARVEHAERTSLKAGAPERVEVSKSGDRIEFEAGELPVFLWITPG